MAFFGRDQHVPACIQRVFSLCHHDIGGVLLCTLLISMAYASCRTKRMARDELVEHMRVDVSEGE